MSPLLSLENIHSFYGDSHILHGVSLKINEGEVVGLLGRNGVGKTTTIKSILGHVVPSKGSIRLRDQELVGLKPHSIANQGIGWVPEERRIFPALTVKENLTLSIRNGADLELAYEYFPKLSELSNAKGRTLSGGEQQMLAIARGLLGNFDILLIDEPSEGLAPQIVESVVSVLNEIKSESTILLIEQNVETVKQVSDRTYFMEKGKIVSETDDLRRDSHLIDSHLKL